MKYQKGGLEVIINARTGFVDNRAINMGTYNHGTNDFSHTFLEMLPYYIYGNTTQDYIVAPHWNPINFPIRATPPEAYNWMFK